MLPAIAAGRAAVAAAGAAAFAAASEPAAELAAVAAAAVAAAARRAAARASAAVGLAVAAAVGLTIAAAAAGPPAGPPSAPLAPAETILNTEIETVVKQLEDSINLGRTDGLISTDGLADIAVGPDDADDADSPATRVSSLLQNATLPFHEVLMLRLEQLPSLFPTDDGGGAGGRSST